MAQPGRPPKTDWSPYPLTPAGRFDRARVKEIYDQSDVVEWIPFCLKMNWPPEALRHKVGSGAWVADKKRRIEERQSAELAQLATDHKSDWIKDVRQTLREYPRAVDNVMVLVADWMKRQIGIDAKPSKAGDILAIAAAVKTCIEAKKNLLGMTELVVKMESQIPAVEAEDSEWTMQLKGQRDVTPKQLTELMLQYLDKPLDASAVVPDFPETTDAVSDADA